ncbi:hypothetical protein [Paenibacillus sp. GCM10012303]|uniref:hypothetical protein n=1 Tax=Paenibacillus sp. GCM10012303 TaxID=3317340 RepID=UPI003615502E
MDRTLFPMKRFNAKRPGALIGTITEVLEYMRLLYAEIGKSRLPGGASPFQHPSESGRHVACLTCDGTGVVIGDIDPSRMIATELSLKHGAVLLWAGTNCGPVAMIKQLAKMLAMDFGKPLAGQDYRFTDILLYGYEKEPVSYVHNRKQLKGFYRGCVHDLRYMRDAGTISRGNLRSIRFFSRQEPCPMCSGSETSSERISITIGGRSVSEVSRIPIPDLLLFIKNLPLSLDFFERERCSEIIEEVETRLIYLHKIGLHTLHVV